MLRPMLRKVLVGVAFAFACSGCTIPRTIDRLQDRSPPPEFGRPGWVRTTAGVGAWVGGILGGVVSIVLLPVTYPVSLLAGDSFSETGREEFLLFPATGGAAIGHALFGTPPDILDHVFRRAWVDEPLPVNTYELVPMEPPGTPTPPRAVPAVPEEPPPEQPGRGQAPAPQQPPK